MTTWAEQRYVELEAAGDDFVYPTFPECGGAEGGCSICRNLDAMKLADMRAPFRKTSIGKSYRCLEEQHDRCRSAWGRHPCRCRCHKAKS